MKKTLLTLLLGGSGLFLLPSQAEALKVKVEPSIGFYNSYNRGYAYYPQVVRQTYDQVYIVNDPYTNVDHYYHYPVVRQYVQPAPYYPVGYRTSSVGYGVNFRFR